jgi:hypothetical protein
MRHFGRALISVRSIASFNMQRHLAAKIDFMLETCVTFGLLTDRTNFFNHNPRGNRNKV